VHRTHTKKNNSPPVIIEKYIPPNPPPKNTPAITADKKKIDPYSAIKINANPTLPYSILNPDTSSDSPSAKSKGVRLASANLINTHRPVARQHKKNLIIPKFTNMNILTLKPSNQKANRIIKRANLTS